MANKKLKAPRHVRLMPEWLGQSGLWLADAQGAFDASDAEEIGLSDDLADRLEAWMDEFDSTYDEDDPAASCFASAAAFAAWQVEGEAIARAIRAQLDPDESLDVQLPKNLVPQ